MSRLPAAKAAICALTVLCSLAAGASAGAAGWQGPATISEPTADAGASPVIALGRSGDAGAVWIDNVVAGGRIAMARKRAGAAWSAPVTVAAPIASTPLLAGVDGEGSVTAAYPAGADSMLVTWPATAAAPSAAPLPGPLTVTGLAVDAAGDAVIAGLSGTPAALTVGYRKSTAGAFAFHTYSYVELGFSAASAEVAINAGGAAIVAFVAGPKLGAVTRTATTDWPPIYETIAAANAGGTPAVGVDDAGNAVAAYTYSAVAGTSTVRAVRRSAGGTYAPSGDLSSATSGSTVSSLNLAVAPSGAAALVWLQSVAATQSVKARLGTTGSGFLGQPEDVNDAGAMEPAAAIGDDGTVVAVWERSTTGGNIGQARVRAAGATGTWGDTRALSAAHANATSPVVESDGRGDFATLSTPYDGTRHPVVLSFYDGAPPALTAVTLTDGPFAGIPVTLGTTAGDAWSAVGTPTWTFGDGASGPGLTVNHTYAAGTYSAHVSVSDVVGNTTGADFAVVVTPAVVTIDKARFTAKWKRSLVAGTLTVAGLAPIPGTYVLDVTKGKSRRIHVSLKLAPGTYSRAIRLPQTLLPGTYHLSLVPATANVQPAAFDVVLAAPPEGVVDISALSRARGGKALHSVHGARTLWVRFHFAAVPAGTLKITWYRTFKGRRTTLVRLQRRATANVSASVALGGRTGTITAILTRGGKVIAQSGARAT
ncbi:MAG: hypothetical protein QOI71_2447 [Gaiellales bacterium]|nr:hypothetical protein [Gaiellales bacterium]